MEEYIKSIYEEMGPSGDLYHERCLIDCFGVEGDNYNRVVGRYIYLSAQSKGCSILAARWITFPYLKRVLVVSVNQFLWAICYPQISNYGPSSSTTTSIFTNRYRSLDDEHFGKNVCGKQRIDGYEKIGT